MLELHRSDVEKAFHQSAAILTHSLNVVQLSPGIAYIEGEAVFVEGVRLFFFELWQQTPGLLERQKYRFHCMDTDEKLIFRYDNAPHHQAIGTFPHHKHTPSGIVASGAPDIVDVIAEVELYVLGL